MLSVVGVALSGAMGWLEMRRTVPRVKRKQLPSLIDNLVPQATDQDSGAQLADVRTTDATLERYDAPATII